MKWEADSDAISGGGIVNLGAMGGIFSVVVVVVDCSTVAGASGVGNFVVVSYLSPNLEFSFAASAAAYVMTRLTPPPLCQCRFRRGGAGF